MSFLRRFSIACGILSASAVCTGLLHAQAVSLDSLVSDHDLRPSPTVQPPLYLLPIKDLVFGSRITRVTDPGQGQNVNRIRHYYSKSNPFNADESFALMYGSDGTVYLYDTKRWAPLRTLNFIDGEPEPQWDPVNPQILYHLDQPPGTRAARAFYKLNVTTGERTLLHDFTQYESVRGKLEGNLDAEGRYYAMVGRKSGIFEAFVYDLRKDKISPVLPVSEAMADDWISVSPSGKYVVMMGKDRSRVYDIQMNHLRDLPKGSFGHGDICLLADGSEALVYDGADHQLDANRNINMAKLGTGDVSKLVRIGWATTPHVSCRNLGMPGWALVSTQGPDKKYPNHDFEIFWVKLDGSAQIRRLAHHHSARSSGGYFAEQHATSNRSGSKVIFSSNWDGKAPIATYLIDRWPGVEQTAAVPQKK
jgi:hypothetical protein